MEHAVARDTQTLSGGEQRRVAAALVLAQQAPIMLLDEPNNHLDPHHALAVLELFAARVREGSAVIAALHDPSLAARFASHALLLHGEGRWEFGGVDEMLGSRRLSELYLTPMLELDAAGRRVFVAG
jgi:iron complex transport system ATP-binding protein